MAPRASVVVAGIALATLAACRPPAHAIEPLLLAPPVVVEAEPAPSPPPETGKGADLAAAVMEDPPSATQRLSRTALLPDLPLPSVPVQVAKTVVPTKEPPAPCRADEGWDGRACVALACPDGASFVRGSGCVRCIGECDLIEPDPERAPWSPATTAFDQQSARDAVRSVDLSACRYDGLVMVTFRPAGDVHRVEARRDSTRAVRDCLRKAFAGVRVPAFGGGVRIVVR